MCAFHHSPQIVTNGLQLYYDAGNSKSYTSGSSSWINLSRVYGYGAFTDMGYDSSNLGSLLFNGTSSRVYSSEGHFFHDACAVSFWFKRNANAGTEWFFHSVGSGTNRYYGYIYATGQIITVRGTNSPKSLGSGYNDNIWHNVVMQWNSSLSIKGYIDGILTLNTSYTESGTSDATYLNLGMNGSTLWYGGNLANFMTYNRELSQSEITQNYNALRGRFGK